MWFHVNVGLNHLSANYLSCEGCTRVGKVKLSNFRTCLVRSSAVNETFPDADLTSILVQNAGECEEICTRQFNVDLISDSVIQRDLVYLITKNCTNRLIICTGLAQMLPRSRKMV